MVSGLPFRAFNGRDDLAGGLLAVDCYRAGPDVVDMQRRIVVVQVAVLEFVPHVRPVILNFHGVTFELGTEGPWGGVHGERCGEMQFGFRGVRDRQAASLCLRDDVSLAGYGNGFRVIVCPSVFVHAVPVGDDADGQYYRCD